jgi:hypothetical protein
VIRTGPSTGLFSIAVSGNEVVSNPTIFGRPTFTEITVGMGTILAAPRAGRETCRVLSYSASALRGHHDKMGASPSTKEQP